MDLSGRLQHQLSIRCREATAEHIGQIGGHADWRVRRNPQCQRVRCDDTRPDHVRVGDRFATTVSGPKPVTGLRGQRRVERENEPQSTSGTFTEATGLADSTRLHAAISLRHNSGDQATTARWLREVRCLEGRSKLIFRARSLLTAQGRSRVGRPSAKRAKAFRCFAGAVSAWETSRPCPLA